ncbi:hypothetical protein AB0N17_35710 [Streptomyces sp. NPDC051133]|uniref:hypothetical protein n=1 Tax=Streptomyces sp. NPDC051133 TaxID=3155521 RepID=UPI003446CE88
MGQHTTDEVYDRLTEVKKQVDENAQQEVTKALFESKIAELKTAIEKGGKKEEKKEEPKTGWDLLKETEPVKTLLGMIKAFTDIAKGGDILAKVLLFTTAVGTAIAFYGKVRTMITGMLGKIKSFLATFKEWTLRATGRLTGQRQYYGRDDNGHFGLRPERTSREMQQSQREASRRFRRAQRGSGASRGSGAGDARDLGQALGRVNSQVEAFDRLKSKLPSAAKMKRTAGAATKLSGALEKVTERLRPAELDELTAATDRLNQKMSAFDHEKLPKPRTLRDISKAAKELHDNADNVREMFRNLATASTHAADAIS